MTLSYHRWPALMLLVAALSLASCRQGDDEALGRKVARVNDSYLYDTDLEGIYDPGMSSRDSAQARKAYIDQWIRQQLLTEQAEKNIGSQVGEIDRRVEEYRQSLLTYYFEKEYVRQNLDTIVLDTEIEAYYAEHESDFTLRDNIVQVAFVKLALDAPNLRQVREYLQSDEQEDQVRLRDYCERYAENYYLDHEVWLLFNDLLREIPIKTYNQEAYLQNNRFVEMEDSLYRYMVDIRGFRMKESVSPLSFERANIRDIIMNKRRLDIIDELHDNIIKRAAGEGAFEIYDTPAQ